MAVIGSAQPMTRRVASSTMTTRSAPIDHVGIGEVVDVEDAVDEVVVVDEQVDHRRDRRGEERVVQKRRRPLRDRRGVETRRRLGLVRDPPEQQEAQRHREEQVRAAEDDRLGRPDARSTHMW